MTLRITSAELVQHAPDLDGNGVAGDAKDREIAAAHFEDLRSEPTGEAYRRAVNTLMDSGRRAQREGDGDYAFRAYGSAIDHAQAATAKSVPAGPWLKLQQAAGWNSLLILEDRRDFGAAALHLQALLREDPELSADPLAHAKLAQLSLFACEAATPGLIGLRANTISGKPLLEMEALTHLERAATGYAKALRRADHAGMSTLGSVSPEQLRAEASIGLVRVVSTYMAIAGDAQNLAAGVANLAWAERMVKRRPELATTNDGIKNALAARAHSAFAGMTSAVQQVRDAMGPGLEDAVYQLLFTLWLQEVHAKATTLIPADILPQVRAAEPTADLQLQILAGSAWSRQTQIDLLRSQLGIAPEAKLNASVESLRAALP